jgi:hypothetical protein
MIAFCDKCPPEWRVWREEDGAMRDYAHVIRAPSAGRAAELWAAQYDYDTAEYSIAGGSTIVTVQVAAVLRPEEVRSFRVRGICEPQYTAEELES